MKLKRSIAKEIKALIKLCKRYGATPRGVGMWVSGAIQSAGRGIANLCVEKPGAGVASAVRRYSLLVYVAGVAWSFLALTALSAVVLALEPLERWTIASPHFYQALGALFGMMVITVGWAAFLRAHATPVLGQRKGGWIAVARFLLMTPAPQVPRTAAA